jgi:hypothetical protein
MKREINAGYVITDRLTVGDTQFVIGQRDKAPAKFVTWRCKKGEKNYYWGHYCKNRLSALEDLCNRALVEIRYLKSFRREKNTAEEPVSQIRKKTHEPER